jgi:nucleoside-diphosphate-sugar epimerase
MHVYLAGATGAVGRSLIPLLLEHGHQVTGTTRSPAHAPALEALGARAVVVDGLDRDAVMGAVRAAGGVALRYGGFYGPGTGITRDGEQIELLRRRQFPLVGDGGAVWSFCQIEDAATATLLALERARPGTVYNVCDDDPAPVREWLPALARAAGAPMPRRLPVWLARMVGGEALVSMLTDARGASNLRAKAELGWVPRWPTWREGFVAAVVAPGAGAQSRLSSDELRR